MITRCSQIRITTQLKLLDPDSENVFDTFVVVNIFLNS